MTALKKGMVIADTYEIVGEIGAGGGGVVFKARHLRLDADVVVKKIRDEALGKIESKKEADILKNLKHTYLPRVYDFIEQPDGVYTVMDFIRGKNLDAAVKHHGRYDQGQVRKWAEQLAEALSYLHSHKPPIIHSDIKPGNIMLTPEGDICLIDFNISLAMGSSMESAIGISAGYSPPEQYRDPAVYALVTHPYTRRNASSDTGGKETGTEVLGAGDDRTEILDAASDGGTAAQGALPEYTQFFGRGIDARSDIYSLGMTLYFLLTGKPPAVDFEKREPIERVAEVSEGFALILGKMTEVSPEHRYRNGVELLKALQNCYKLDHRYAVMHRAQTGLLAGAVACLAAGILLVSGGMYQLRREESSAYYQCIQQAQEAMAVQDYETAGSMLEAAKEISEVRIDAYVEELYLLYLRGDYEECIRCGENDINASLFLLESEDDERQLGDTYYIIGNAYFEEEDYANARNLFEYALEHNTKNGLYYRDYAITLAKLGQADEAEKQLEQGIALGLARDSVYMAQGEIAHMKGQDREAVEYLTQAIKTTVDAQMKKRAVLLCANVYKTMGNDAADDEIALLEQYSGQFEGNTNLVMTQYLAEAYTRKAKTDEAQARVCWEKALELFQSVSQKGYVTFQLQENMAILYENLDDFDAAQELLTEMAESYPKRYEVYKRLAYLEADRQQMNENADRDYGRMQIYYEKAKELYSDKEQDMEMDMLDNMMRELQDGGWL